MNTRHKQASFEIANSARHWIEQAASAQGVPLEIAVAAVHAQVSAMLALRYGGEAAADFMRQEANRIEGELSARDIAEEIALATSIPVGRA